MNKIAFLVLGISIFNFLFVGCDNADSAENIKLELESLTSQLDDAWNKGNAVDFAKLWSENATNISPMGETDEGREALEKNMAVQFSGDMKGTTHKLVIEQIHSVSPSVAIADGTAEVAMGNYEPWKSRFTAVFLKEKSNKWKIAHMRAYIFIE